ncbi:hypothetical protein C8F01DRAFT_1251640 [Mycena amicta]|nr:hypothetical protein C8F01DRAFT_1251640 [Mycena amicta]
MGDDADMNSLGAEEATAKMWSVYISQAEKYDKALVAGWRADMKGILIFAGLFSAALTAFIIESSQSLTPDPTVLLLVAISKQLNANTPIQEPTGPSASVVVCNALWFTSLGLSLASAVVATLVEQWARDFLNKSGDIRPSPVERARICSYLYSGLKQFRMHAIVDAIPLLLHMSLLLFFAGLVVFLYPVNGVLTLIAAIIFLIMTLVYAALTIMPLLFANSPCRTPLSSVLWRIGQLFALIDWKMDNVMMHRAVTHRRIERDKRALCWTIKSLTAEHEFETFVTTLPQVIWSWAPLIRRRRHDELLQTLIDYPDVQLGARISSLLLSSENGLLDKAAKQHRTVSCLKALLAFAMTAELGPDRVIDFPFEPSTFTYLAKTKYGPAQAYIPALRACGTWSLYCSFLTGVHRLLVLCDSEVHAQSREPRRELVLLGLRGITKQHRQYLAARGLNTSRVQGDLENAAKILSESSPARLTHHLQSLQQALRRLWERKVSVQLDILCGFLLDSSNFEQQPYNFKETIENVLHPGGVQPVHVLPPSLTPTLRLIIDKANGAPTVTHLDHAIGVLLHLCDTTLSPAGEQSVTDSLINYLNKRDLPEASLYILHKCDVALVWSRVAGRLARREHPDEVLIAIWKLCQLFLDPRFGSSQLNVIPLRSLVDTASKLPVSPYSLSVHAMLRTVASHAAESIHIPSTSARDASPLRVAVSLVELNYLTARLLSSTTPPDSTDVSAEVDVHILGSQVIEARLTLFNTFLEACTSPLVPYKAAETLTHLGSFPVSVVGLAVPAEIQNRFAAAVRRLVQAGDEPLIQIVLECPLVAGLQWIDSSEAIKTMRRALDGAFVSMQQLPAVVDALGRLLVVEDPNGAMTGTDG